MFEHMKNFIGNRLSSNKSYRESYRQHRHLGWDPTPGPPGVRQRYSPLYYRGSDVGTESKGVWIRFTKKKDGSRGVLQKIQCC